MDDVDYCICLAFLDDWSYGRVERYPGCPRHWRVFDELAPIVRESVPVADPEAFLDAALT